MAWLTPRMWVSASQQLMPVRHVALDVHPSDRATTSAVNRGAGLLTPLAKWVSPLTLVANEGWRGGYRHLYCMIHDPEASGFLAPCRSLLCTTTASYMRSDITCASLREYVSWATATADFEFSTRLSVLIQTISLTGR